MMPTSQYFRLPVRGNGLPILAEAAMKSGMGQRQARKVIFILPGKLPANQRLQPPDHISRPKAAAMMDLLPNLVVNTKLMLAYMRYYRLLAAIALLLTLSHSRCATLVRRPLIP